MSLLRTTCHGFLPVVDKDCKILILGSFPSIKSQEQGFYYMHPQNRFWRILSEIFGQDLTTLDIPQKTKFLLSRHVALYDTIESCTIYGSSDVKIFDVVPADILGIINNSSITHVFLVGLRSKTEFKKAFPNLSDKTTYLPSPSPANAKMKLQALVDVWKPAILKYL